MGKTKKQNKKGYGFVWAMLLLPLAMLLQFICKNNPQFTESIYSRHIYPVISAVISPAFGIMPFSVAEVILLVLIILFLRWIVAAVASLFIRGPMVLLRGALKLMTLFATGYFLFTVMWGLNYYRQPLTVTLALKDGAPTKTELSDMMNREIEAVNGIVGKIDFDKSGHSYYKGGFGGMRTQVNAGYDWLQSALKPRDRYINRVRAWPKGIFPSAPVSYTGIEGIFIPFTYEPSVNTDFPQFVLPFTVSHETAHFKGFAREDEANFLAYLACSKNPDVYYQYSGHMNAILYLSDALYETDSELWKQDTARLDSRAKKDFNSYYEYLDKHKSKAADIATGINDNYLKSQGQAGVITYDNFVNLLCGEYRADYKELS